VIGVDDHVPRLPLCVTGSLDSDLTMAKKL
jgi:hypothetical protein